MPSIAIWFGRLLIILGVVGYGYTMFYTEKPAVTSLIPAVFGLILMVLGHLANAKESLRKHLMHAAVIVGIIGFAVPLVQIIRGLSTFVFDFKAFLLISMTVLCLAFVILCVKSFISARKAA